MGIFDFVTAQNEASSLRGQSQFAVERAEFNARLTEMDAKDVILGASKDVKLLRERGSQVKGAQRAALAAQGIDVDSGSAYDVQEDTAMQIELDALSINNNARRKAWGLKVEALNMRGQAKFNKLAAETKSRQTIIAGAVGSITSGLSLGRD